MLKERKQSSTAFDFSSVSALFVDLTSKDRPHLDTYFVMDRADTNITCIKCRKSIRKGSLLLRASCERASFCKSCYKEIKPHGHSIVPRKVSHMTKELVELAEYTYRHYVTNMWLTGVRFYDEPFKALQQFIAMESYIKLNDTSSVVKVASKEIDLNKEETLLFLLYIYTRIINIKRKLVKQNMYTVNTFNTNVVKPSQSCYIEDVFCPYTYARLQVKDITTKNGISYVHYASPKLWGRTFELQDNRLLRELS